MPIQEIQNGFETALASRTPFVVRGAARDWPARAWNLQTFDSTFKSGENAQYWYHLPRDNSHSTDLPCPRWLNTHWCQGERHFSLERPIRFIPIVIGAFFVEGLLGRGNNLLACL